MKHMAVDLSMINRIFTKINDSNEPLTMSPDSCMVLCDGLQKHLKNIMESVIKLGDGRYSTSTVVAHRDILSTMSSGEIGDPTMSKVAMKWGPSIGNLLADEDVESREAYKQIRKDDEKKLEEKMKQVEESLAAIAGTKRKTASDGADLAWWKKDVSQLYCFEYFLQILKSDVICKLLLLFVRR